MSFIYTVQLFILWRLDQLLGSLLLLLFIIRCDIILAMDQT